MQPSMTARVVAVLVLWGEVRFLCQDRVVSAIEIPFFITDERVVVLLTALAAAVDQRGIKGRTL